MEKRTEIKEQGRIGKDRKRVFEKHVIATYDNGEEHLVAVIPCIYDETICTEEHFKRETGIDISAFDRHHSFEKAKLAFTRVQEEIWYGMNFQARLMADQDEGGNKTELLLNIMDYIRTGRC